ncbi:hypothetical protein SNE510_58570 [Streptomyces sp. NE5-10]|nr:hypothetical protein SNE510_58570 [Streptomyces sp. NE5-10]
MIARFRVPLSVRSAGRGSGQGVTFSVCDPGSAPRASWWKGVLGVGAGKGVASGGVASEGGGPSGAPNCDDRLPSPEVAAI